MEIDNRSVKAEVEAVFAEYERALVTNDVAALDRLFLKAPTTIRYGGGENLYGYEAIAAFRAARSPAGLKRRLEKTVVTTYGRDFAVAATLFRRDSGAGQGRPADADLGAHGRRLAGGRRPCVGHRRSGLGLRLRATGPLSAGRFLRSAAFHRRSP